MTLTEKLDAMLTWWAYAVLGYVIVVVAWFLVGLVLSWWDRREQRRLNAQRCLYCGRRRDCVSRRYCESPSTVRISGPGQRDPHRWPEKR